MREIKFRAWNKQEKMMAYDIQNEYDTIAGVCYWKNGNKTDKEPGMSSFGSYLRDNDYVVMQFTGLYDCEKREIYEGDVVLVSNQMDYIQRAIIKGIVVNEWGSYGVKIIKVCQWEKYLVSPPEIEAILSFLNILNTRIIEVIGNVHENPELLT